MFFSIEPTFQQSTHPTTIHHSVPINQYQQPQIPLRIFQRPVPHQILNQHTTYVTVSMVPHPIRSQFGRHCFLVWDTFFL